MTTGPNGIFELTIGEIISVTETTEAELEEFSYRDPNNTLHTFDESTNVLITVEALDREGQNEIGSQISKTFCRLCRIPDSATSCMEMRLLILSQLTISTVPWLFGYSTVLLQRTFFRT